MVNQIKSFAEIKKRIISVSNYPYPGPLGLTGGHKLWLVQWISPPRQTAYPIEVV